MNALADARSFFVLDELFLPTSSCFLLKLPRPGIAPIAFRAMFLIIPPNFVRNGVILFTILNALKAATTPKIYGTNLATVSELFKISLNKFINPFATPAITPTKESHIGFAFSMNPAI